MNELTLQTDPRGEDVKTEREEVYGCSFHPIRIDQPLLVNSSFNVFTAGERPIFKSGYTFKGIPFDINFVVCLADLSKFETPFGDLDSFFTGDNYFVNTAELTIPLALEGIFDINKIDDYDTLSEWMIKLNLNNIIYRMPLFDSRDATRDQIRDFLGAGYKYRKGQVMRNNAYCNTVMPMDTSKLSSIEMQFIPRLQLIIGGLPDVETV